MRHKIGLSVILAVLIIANNDVGGHVVEPGCKPEASICRFFLSVDFQYTMVFPRRRFWIPVTAEADGLRLKNTENCSRGGPLLTDEEASHVIIGDGHYRKVIAINGSVPGPPIVVYHGQQVSLVVHNKLRNIATTVHFHGLHQWGTPWMDGVGHLSQCPIGPGEFFNYRFIASPTGTSWYHAHVGEQYAMGFYGAFIVLPRSQEEENEIRGVDPLPPFDGDYYAMIQDWPKTDSFETSLMMHHGLKYYSDGLDQEVCRFPGLKADGAEIQSNYLHTGVVNGKGWYYPNSTSLPENRHIPLETFLVEKGGVYRFRFISASGAYSFRFSIDGHPLYVIATDGGDVITKQVDSIVIYPGERYDFYIIANDSQHGGSYWIRFETLEMYNHQHYPVKPQHFEAVLKYAGASVDLPSSTSKHCSWSKPCAVVGLPFLHLLHPSDTDVYVNVPVTSFRSAVRNSFMDDVDSEQGDVMEHFFNFGRASFVNGIRNAIPRTPLQVYVNDSEAIIHKLGCQSPDRVHQFHCLNNHYVPLGSVVDIVVTAIQDRQSTLAARKTHAIHIHGFRPAIIDMGFAVYDENTNYLIRENPDLRLVPEGDKLVPAWVNSSWSGGNKPGLLGADAPTKDTIAVPDGGYFIMRFKADNPGFWIMHCHTDYHAVVGMSIVLQVGDPSDMAQPPSTMPRCSNFVMTDEEFEPYIYIES